MTEGTVPNVRAPSGMPIGTEIEGADADRVSPAIGSGATPPRQLLGIVLVVLSTVAIAIVPTFARLAYDGGSDPLTVITARSVVTATVCFLAAALLRRSLRMPSRPLASSLALGALYGAHLLCFLGAIVYLPVNMVILLYFLHPLMIGLFAIAGGRDRFSLLRLGALVGAIAGLGLAIGFSFDDLDPIGIALASVAAVIAATVIVGSGTVLRKADSFAVLFWMMLAGAVVLSVLSLAQGDIRPPSTAEGWLGLGGVAIAYTVGTMTFFASLPLLGAVRAAMITNLEPVLGVLFAMVILGERVSPLQGIGIVLVIAAIFAMEIRPATAKA